MKHFIMEMIFSTKGNTTIYCWKASTKLKNDIIQSWGNSPDEAIKELFEAVSFESN